MPDLGLTKAIRKAVGKGAKEARVVRPGEVRAPRPATAGLDVPTPVAADELVAPAIEPVTPPVMPEAPPSPAAAPTAPIAEAPPSFILPEQQLAQRVSEARLGDFALDETFQTNFDTITTTDDVKAVVADVAQANAKRIDEARRGTITNEQLQGLADDLDLNTEVVKTVLERESGSALNAETILAARQVLNSSAERLKTLADKVAGGQATDLERLQFRRQLQFHGEYQTQFMGARAEAGRALNAFAIPVGSDAQQVARIRELVDAQYGDTDKLARAIRETSDPTAVNKLARDYGRAKIAGSLNELFINSILSGPKTHVVNTVGNALMQSMTIAETAVAARIGRFLGTEEAVEIGEAMALLHGTLGATRDGLRLAGRAMRAGKTIDEVTKFEAGSLPSGNITAQNLLPPAWQNTPLGGTVDVVGAVIRAPTERVMAPTDEFFKTLAYRAEVERQAFLHVQQQVVSGAIQLEDAARVAKEFMESVPLKAQAAAEDYAKYVTFQNPLEEVGRKFQTAIRSVPILGLIAPFIRTPINIFKAGLLGRSPVAFFTKKFYADIAKGGRTRDMALARVSMGSATAAYVAMEVAEGRISGGGPKDPEARKLLEQTGWRPYSIRVGNTWHSYARMEPWASVVGATADTVEIMSYINEDVDSLKDENQQAVDAAAAVIAGIANNTMSKTFMKGMSDFSETLSDPGRYVQTFAASTAQSIMPYSALRAQVAKTQDPYLREAWTILDKLQTTSGIPGWSQDAPPRRDLFGKPRKHAEGSVLGSMSPVTESAAKSDPLLGELVLLMKQTRQVPVTMPGKSVEGMRLKADEYNDLVLISRTQPIFGDRAFREELERVMDLDAYQEATPVGKADLLRSVQNSADEIARAQLEFQNQNFADRISLYRAKQNRLRFGEE